jgi:hypothetical protein
LEIERGSTRSHPVEISIRKRLRTCRKTDYRMKVRLYADGRSKCFTQPEIVEWNPVQSTKLLRVTVRSHVSTAPTMHESRQCIDP